MRRTTLLLAASFAAAGCTAVQLSHPAAMTRAQAKALPPEALSRRIFGTLASTMLAYPVPDWNRRLIFRGLRELHFVSPAVFPGERGLCEAHFVVVDFAPPADPGYLDPPVRVAGMRTSRVLILRDPALVGRSWSRGDAEYSGEEAACAALDPRRHRLIAGVYAYEAAVLLRWTADLLERARAGRPPDVPLACPNLPDEASRPADCLRQVAAMRVENVIEARLCDGPAFPRALCYTVSDGARALDWELAPGDDARPARVTFDFIITT